MKIKNVTVYSRVIEAQAALANKKQQGKWEIATTSNGWFVVVPKKRKAGSFLDNLLKG